MLELPRPLEMTLQQIKGSGLIELRVSGTACRFGYMYAEGGGLQHAALAGAMARLEKQKVRQFW